MKKVIFLVILITVMSVFCFAASAEQGDSVSVTRADKQNMGIGTAEIVIKYYNGAFMHGFAKGASIEELTGEEYVLEEIYGSSPTRLALPVSNKTVRQGQIVNLQRISTGDVEWFMQNAPDAAVFALRAVGSANVTGVWCLSGESSHDGVYIYIQTPKGDCVLYREYATAQKTYLFTVEEFFKFAEAVEADRYENRDLKGGPTPINQIYKVGRFRILTVPIWLRMVIILACIISAPIVITKTVRAHRKKKI